MIVRFAGKDVPIKDLIAQCLAANYLQFGFADDGEADKVAERLLSVLDQLGCEIVRKQTAARQERDVRRIEVYVTTGFVGSKKTEIIEVEDDMTDEEIDAQAQETMFSMIEWSWRDADEKKR